MSRLTGVTRSGPWPGDGPWAGRPRARRAVARPVATAGVLVGLLLVLLLLLLLVPAGAGAAAASWSPPGIVTHCPAASQPSVVFPSADPHTSAGPGAILWSGYPVACGGAGPGSGVGVAPIGPNDVAAAATSLPLAPGPPTALGGLAATLGTGDGRIVVAAGLGTAPASPAGVVEGRAGGPFGPPNPLRSRTAPLAGATSYLGDIALATVRPRSGQVELRLQRHGAPGLSRPVALTGGASAVSAVAVGLDYRGDAIVVWAQDGWIYARVLRADGRLEATERVAPTPPAPHLQALISDDNHGIVAWTSERPTGSGTATRVYLDASSAGLHFGRPRLLEAFRSPPGLQLPEGSLRLVRLASEGVMMAWTGMSAGRYVVRAASVSLFASRPSRTISGPSGDAILADLATGPRDEAIALWTSAPRRAGGFDVGRTELLAARGVAVLPGLAAFSAPEAVAGPGAVAAPRAAVDPTSDTAVAVWQNLGTEPGIAYTTRGRATAGLRRGGPAAHADPGRGGWPTGAWVLAAVAVLGAAAALARAALARRTRGLRATQTDALPH